MARNPVFKPRDVEAIVDVIRDWPPKDKLSWEGVCKKSKGILGYEPTRQGLCKKKDIANAFKAKKQGVRDSPKESSPMPSSLAVAQERIAHLNAKIRELNLELNNLRDTIVLWQYNAEINNLSGILNKPLPTIDRGANKPVDGKEGKKK